MNGTATTAPRLPAHLSFATIDAEIEFLAVELVAAGWDPYDAADAIHRHVSCTCRRLRARSA